MMYPAWLALLCAACASPASAASPAEISNPAIDMEGYLRFAKAAAAERETHRVSEDEFMRMSREPETIVLDARSPQKYDELHIRGPYIALYTYGYRNIYELGPYVDIGGSSSSLRARIGRAAGTPAEIDREERTLRAEIAEELRGR